MSQLLPGSLISLVSAVLLARWMNQAGLPWLALSLAVCPLVFLGRRAVCFLLIFEAGLFLTIQRLSLPANHVAGCLPRQVPVLWGTVLEQTREEIFSSEILLKAEKWSAGEDREFSCCGLVLVKSSPFLSLEPGQKVRLENVRLRYPGSDGNPGRSDRSLYWESRGIFLLGQAREVSVVDARQPVHLYLLVLLRRRIETIFSGRLRGFPEETALLQTITLGRKQVVSFLRVLGLRSGTYHLLVISGLHVGFLFLLWSVLSFPWRRRFLRYHRVFSLAGLLVIWGYAWLTGLHLPIVRAALMISFFLLGEVVGRDISGLESITLAALVLLLANPLSLFDAGFQLSFVATAGILLTGSALEEYSFTRNLAWRRFWCASLGAYIFVLPLVLYHFGQVCLTGILNNLVVVPVAAVTTMVGFLFWWWPVIFAWPARCLAWLLLALLTVLARFSPAVSFSLNLPATLLSYGMLLVLVKRGRLRPKLIFGAILLAGLIIVLVSGRRPEPKQEIVLFSAPRLVCSLTSRESLVLFTPDHDRERTITRVVLPWAWESGYRRLEAMFFSEISSDHVGAWRQFLKTMPVRHLYDLDRPELFPVCLAERPAATVLKTGEQVTTGAGEIYLLSSGEKDHICPAYLLKQGRCRVLLISEVTPASSDWLRHVKVDVAVIGKIATNRKTRAGVEQLSCLYLIRPKRLKSEDWCERIPKAGIFYLSEGAVVIRTDRQPFQISQWSEP